MKEELEIKPCFCGRLPYEEIFDDDKFAYVCKSVEGEVLDHEIISSYSSTEEGAIKKWNTLMDSIKNVYKEKQDAPSADKENAAQKELVTITDAIAKIMTGEWGQARNRDSGDTLRCTGGKVVRYNLGVNGGYHSAFHFLENVPLLKEWEEYKGDGLNKYAVHYTFDKKSYWNVVALPDRRILARFPASLEGSRECAHSYVRLLNGEIKADELLLMKFAADA